MRSSSLGLRRLAVALWLPVVLVLVWWFASAQSTSFAFPPLADILQAMRAEWFFAQFWSDFVPSVLLVFEALALAIVVGVGVGILIGSSEIGERAARPLLDFIRGIPKVLLISPALVIMGVGPGLTLFVMTFGAIWPILLAAIDGMRGIPTQLQDLRRTYQIGRLAWLRRIALPAASPSIFAGIRTSLAIAVVLLVPAQAVGATSGLGFQLKLASDAFKFPEVWGTTIMFAILGYLLNVLFLGLVERQALHWFNAQGGSR